MTRAGTFPTSTIANFVRQEGKLTDLKGWRSFYKMAIGEVGFLRKMVRRELPLSPQAYEMTSRIMAPVTLSNGWTVQGKTGTASPVRVDGDVAGALQYGWYVGWASKGERTIVFGVTSTSRIKPGKVSPVPVVFCTRSGSPGAPRSRLMFWSITPEMPDVKFCFGHLHVGALHSKQPITEPAQIKGMKKVAGTLRLDLAAYRELEAFAQLGTELDKATQRQLDRGRRMVELLKQKQHETLPFYKQVVSIFGANNGLFEGAPDGDKPVVAQ